MSKRDYRRDVQQEQSTVVASQEGSALIMPTAAASYAVAELKAFQNTLLASLAKQTMDNTALLIANEGRCINYAPVGAEEYRKIIESYVDTALSLVMGDD